MGQSAEVAKDRLWRLAFPEWKRRVEELLSIDGYTMTDFPDYDFESWHRAGVRAFKVADTILTVHRRIETAMTKVK
jgi:hypothetical protein